MKKKQKHFFIDKKQIIDVNSKTPFNIYNALKMSKPISLLFYHITPTCGINLLTSLNFVRGEIDTKFLKISVRNVLTLLDNNARLGIDQ